jgi:YidC/Oxa1 family membrane protein insertase
MDIQRLILFVALGLVSMMLMQNWQTYQAEKYPSPAVEQNTGSGVPNTQNINSGTESSPVPAATSSEGVPDIQTPSTQPVQQSTTVKGELIEVVTDLLDIRIDSLGGGISYAGLNQYPEKLGSPEIPVVLMQDNPEQRYLAESGLTGSATPNLPNHHTQYTVQKLRYDLGASDTLEVPLSFTSPEGVVYTKIYTFERDSYHIDVQYRIENNSASTWKGHFYGHLLRTEPDTGGAGGILTGRMPSYTGGAYFTPEEHYNKIKFSAMKDKDGDLPLEAPSGWIAMLQHYFVGTWLPETEGSYRFYNQVNNQLAQAEYTLGFLDLAATTIAPGSSAEMGASLYIGPKERDRLDAEGVDKLALTVDFGWLTVIAEPLFWVMRKINSVVGNWGWTIILITILIKAMFLPLSAASYRSMAKMKKLSPRLKTLKERYGDDKQAFQQEMMKLYREEKVNPAGGCLPILVQIPVFIALYWVLLESVELRQAPWAFWIQDLSSKDPYFILPLLMGGSMLVQQLLNPAPMDPMQQKIMMALPVVFTVFFLSFPAGLVLYWVVNNTLSIAQQWMITRRYQ